MGVAINTIGGPLVLLEDTGPVGHWLEVSLKGFQAGAVLTATLPNGHSEVEELHDGSSYLSSEDPRAHFGLGTQTTVSRLTIHWPNGPASHLSRHPRQPDHHRRPTRTLSPAPVAQCRIRGRVARSLPPAPGSRRSPFAHRYACPLVGQRRAVAHIARR